jgi:regulator of protease activity HflC (stomatin/prohibitin superfamily)
MVRVTGAGGAMGSIKSSFVRLVILTITVVILLSIFYTFFVSRVNTNEYGVMQKKFGFKTGIMDETYGPGLYFVGFGTTIHTFPREIQVLEASNDIQEALDKAHARGIETHLVQDYFERRDRVLGSTTHRVVDALNVQTSDGYSVSADITLLYSIQNPVVIAREFGWGSLYVDAFVINTFRNGVLTTLGKMNAESFYNEKVRIAAVKEAEDLLRKRFSNRGFIVHKLLLRNYEYAPTYEKSLHDKKVAVQMTEKNRKESLVNEERAKLRQIESKGNAAITIAESEVNVQIAKVLAEADLYSSQTRATGDKEVNVATAEAKRLKADALTQTGGKYVVALEIAKMFDNIEGAVMTPEQYIAFIRNAWSIIGVSSSGSVPSAPSEKKQ